MSTDTQPNSRLKSLWLIVPALAVVAALVVIGTNAVRTTTAKAPSDVTVTEAVVEAELVPVAGATAPAPATLPVSDDFSAGQKQAIETIVKDYLLANPEILLQVQTALEAKLEAEQAERFKAAIADNASEIYRSPNAALAGNPDGDITVVEFFDYNCGYCKRGLGDVVKLVDSDPNVRVVFKELPILSKGSEEASRVALAARKQGKYWDVHQALLAHRGQVNEETALKIAENLGLDMDQLKLDMASDEVTAQIKASEALANKMGINGTPHFLVGDRSIPGAPQDLYDQLSSHVGEMRKSGCSYC